MGYTYEDITVQCRLERHNSDGDRRDDAARDRLHGEILALIDSDPEYARIAGVTRERITVEAVQPGLISYRRNLIP